MTSLQIILLSFAISIDSLALSIVDGAMLPRIKPNELLKFSLFISGWQTVTFMIGHYLIPFSTQLGLMNQFSTASFAYRILSAVIFISLGLMMLKKGMKNDYINEKRQPFIKFNRMVKISVFTSFDSFIAGIGLYFTGIQIRKTSILLFLVSMISVMVGIFIGFWFGYEQKSKVYGIGSIIFFILAVNILVK